MLTLQDIIYLTIKNNPNIERARLSHQQEMLNLLDQKWQFNPHYSLSAGTQWIRDASVASEINYSHQYQITPGVSLKTPIGTEMAVSAQNQMTDRYRFSVSASVMQPLMRGFGRPIVEASLYNALDSEKISRLTMEMTLRSNITNVINAYLDLYMAEENLKIDKDALTRANESVQQTKKFIKAGHKAGNELVTVTANVESAKFQLENDENSFKQSRAALLTLIGINPDAPIQFASMNINELIGQYHLEDIEVINKLALENNIQYQIDDIVLNGATSRTVMLAKDNNRPQLNLETTLSTQTVVDDNANSLKSTAQSQGVALTFVLPIDNQLEKNALENALISLKQAKLAMKSAKWQFETDVMNAWNSANSAKRSLIFAENAEVLQNKTYQISYQKYLHGLIDSLELQSAQLQFITAEQHLLSAKINYLKTLVTVDSLKGSTLITWRIPLKAN